MNIRLGLSSGSFPRLTAIELAQLLRNLSADTVDLRAGKGQGWEGQGVAPFLHAGIEVGFIGLSIVLGDESYTEEIIRRLVEPYCGYPLKVFSMTGCTDRAHMEITKKQVEILAKAAAGTHRILVETHHGYSSPEELVDLYQEFGVHLLLDTLGLARIASDPLQEAARLAPFVRAVHLKGFDWSNPERSCHVPLAAANLEKTSALLKLVVGEHCMITVETKSGSALEDFQALRSVMRDNNDKSKVMTNETCDYRR